MPKRKKNVKRNSVHVRMDDEMYEKLPENPSKFIRKLIRDAFNIRKR